MTFDEKNQEQARNILRYIDATQSEAVKSSIFGQLGRECFTTRKMDGWIDSFGKDMQAFLDHINVQQASKYWERLEFNAEHDALVLTGRIVTRCACAFAEGPEPPLALCHYCCKHFQEQIFGRLLGQKVAVEITESFLLGGERCSTVIHLSKE